MAEDNRKRKGTFGSRLVAGRTWVQAFFAMIWLAPTARWHAMCSPVFQCHACPLSTFACPVGVLAQFTALHVFPFVAVGVLLVFAAMFGGFMCGWACPFGFLQDLMAKVPTPKLALPKWMGWFRYAVLVGLVLAVPFWLGLESPWFFCRLCPAGALEAAMPNVVHQAVAGAEHIPWPNATKMTILGLFLVAAFFIRRPWCTLFCPLGAIYGLANRFSFFLLRFNRERCIDCTNCRSLCQYGGDAESRIPTTSCNRCLACDRCQAVVPGTVLDRTDGTVR